MILLSDEDAVEKPPASLLQRDWPTPAFLAPSKRSEQLNVASLVTMLSLMATVPIGIAVAALRNGWAVGVATYIVLFVLMAGLLTLVVYLLASPGYAADYPARRGAATNECSTVAIVAFVASLLTSIGGIVLGHIALRDINRTGRRGRALAITALVFGYGYLVVVGALLLLVEAP